MRQKYPFLYRISIYLFLFSCIYILFRSQEQITEKVYSQGIYPYISSFCRFVLGIVPFSVGDILYILIPIGSIFWFIKSYKVLRKNPFIILQKIILFITIIISSFYFLWGFNYYRVPLSKQLGWELSYTEADLEFVTDKLIQEANGLHSLLSTKPEELLSFPFTQKEIYDKIPQGYEIIRNKFPELVLKGVSIKSSLYSKGLSYMGYSGYLNPFTGEAQVNSLAMQYSFPTVCAHEVAHQLGYASEKEANFIGFLATYHHPEPFFRYSGTLFALRYCLSEIRKSNPDNYTKKVALLREGILENYREASNFWRQYDNPLEVVFKESYDTFLKANAQAGGIQSYDYVTSLLIHYLK